MNYVHENNLDVTTLRLLILGSDSCPITEYKNLVKTYGENMRVINSYGVTEATIDSSYYEAEYNNIPQMINTPIGKPLNNTKYYVLNSLLELQPIGVYGELYIGGCGVARGYLNKPELTNERFVPNCFSPGEKMYKTGDLARWLPDGNIEFLGRIDNQVKVRGFRIEIGEIEAKLLGNEYIKEAVVIDRIDNTGFTYLCAYVISQNELATSELRDYLSNYLTDYMIPSYIIQLDKMPLTPNGKIDRKALPVVQEKDISIGSKYEAPRNEMEEKLALVWREVLEVEKIGINHNFFEAGGHSLKAFSLVLKIHKELNVKIPLKQIFNCPTIKGIAEYIKGRETSIYSTIKKAEKKEFYNLSSAQKRLYILNQIGGSEITYNLPSVMKMKGRFQVNSFENAFNALIDRHEALRTS
ncbi:non-ribosomal peptide synthetase, partial [Bacillus wiedmannii]|uniref:AMP-binding protein n=1 Tax=Bacillus wiedmannii TaxID=1890302 RepID=UPI000BFAFF92